MEKELRRKKIEKKTNEDGALRREGIMKCAKR
jgi:hypothetical protein